MNRKGGGKEQTQPQTSFHFAPSPSLLSWKLRQRLHVHPLGNNVEYLVHCSDVSAPKFRPIASRSGTQPPGEPKFEVAACTRETWHRRVARCVRGMGTEEIAKN